MAGYMQPQGGGIRSATQPPNIGMILGDSLVNAPPGTSAAQAPNRGPMSQEDYYRQIFDMYTPFTEAGNAQIPGMLEGATGGGYADRIGSILQDPNFQPLLQEQQGQLDQSLASSGMRRSGYGMQANANLPMELAQNLEGQSMQRMQSLFGMGADGTRNQGNALQKLEELALNKEAAADQRSAQRRQRNVSTAGSIISTIGALALLSDERLKKNVKKVDEQKGVNIYTWDWNDIARREFGLTGSGRGVIAQEVQKTHPEAVKPYGGFLTVDLDQVLGDL